MDWRGYAACCHSHARDPSAKSCPECGQFLMRCAEYGECGALVDRSEFCASHIAPRLYLEPLAVSSLKVGQCATLRLVLANESKLPGVLRVDSIRAAEPGTELTEIPLLWNELRSSEERTFALETGVLEAGGARRLELVVVTRRTFGGLEERHAFAAELVLAVEERAQASQVTQHIHVTGGHFEPGASAVVQTGPAVHENKGFELRSPEVRGRTPLREFQRAEAYELREAIRGGNVAGAACDRDVEVRYVGFDSDEVPATSRPFRDSRVLRCGRNSRVSSERNPEPNDIVLRAYDPATKLVDRDRSLRVSGRQCEIALESGRLSLRATGSNPTHVNGELLARGSEVILRSGDRIGALGASDDSLGFVVEMYARRGRIETVTLRKVDRLTLS